MNPLAGFSTQEWQVLAGQLRLRSEAERDVPRSLVASELLNDAVCSALLDELGPVIGSPSRRITASLLGKRLSFLLTGACLYAMSAYDKGLTLSLDNTYIEYGHDDGLWASSLPLRSLDAAVVPPEQREAWRLAIATQLFAGLLQPLWRSLHGVTGVSRRILWENTAVRVYSLYEKRLAKLECVATRQRCAEDLRWLTDEAPASVFGLDYNPLAHFNRPVTLLDNGTRAVRFRRTCCFYYQASNPVEYCSTCPLIRPKATR
ncbi:IucA/IucC family C-terminal-domain containing protein [Phytopseudomonas seleniipraecipitans]|uniref:Ferric iron reductase protein FhuF, involved in iron transport n=1 Tax=Phytopseudomonas seleniipraecipitans TaxID=640205 RepID=A0A1G7QXW7_9GAMM|nr:IucA/IucC family C-terminal-domain containing protein [Pseudomonas seleniipraecipitans]SDG03284.1 Ferric iron reductase protein FhuF, involved in iron transport [Pseudomonas seleniipraecipitans]